MAGTKVRAMRMAPVQAILVRCKGRLGALVHIGQAAPALAGAGVWQRTEAAGALAHAALTRTYGRACLWRQPRRPVPGTERARCADSGDRPAP
ncbi:hypothetical protein CBM2592_B20007 [Cupriavidus taiwanensis]|nr:hypothetical protein CBM2588_B20008 [Cupriavidus taiwanensis]SOY69769.1 hypothetical protein CBM2592_B20007 [Cupriavidus taiwanensis]SOY92180.1 hypothetical protein CBM2591_B10299 [Cupriavidus taiwanensis]SOZ29380.1 hypothetical protein CBM2608_B20007 [Cupriavidus taiwanensis]SOZ73857.1 hypothetical protein CBM2617_B20007 [Cupriavidus taiwanensis]